MHTVQAGAIVKVIATVNPFSRHPLINILLYNQVLKIAVKSDVKNLGN